MSNFDQQHLSQLGFVGFVPVRSLSRRPSHIPTSPGVYAVTLDQPTPEFLVISVGGHFKGKPPSVERGALDAKWVDATETLYIGRAGNLRSRIDLLARYGRGEPVAHQGGRYLWQLAAHDRLRVGWRVDPDPVGTERELLEMFETELGRLPFANLVRGTRELVLA